MESKYQISCSKLTEIKFIHFFCVCHMVHSHTCILLSLYSRISKNIYVIINHQRRWEFFFQLPNSPFSVDCLAKLFPYTSLIILKKNYLETFNHCQFVQSNPPQIESQITKTKTNNIPRTTNLIFMFWYHIFRRTCVPCFLKSWAWNLGSPQPYKA